MTRKTRLPALDLLAPVLMLFLTALVFGFFPANDSEIRLICRFAPYALFLLFGFRIFRDEEDEERRLFRAMLVSLFLFLSALSVAVVVNAIYYKTNGADFFSVFFHWKTWGRFLLFCRFPFVIGSGLWISQGLFYATLLLWIMKKCGLEKVFVWLPLLCFPILLLTGEFAGLTGFRLLDMSYLPPGWLNAALPYLLLGRVLARRVTELRRIPWFVYPVAVLTGVAVTLTEPLLLNMAGSYVNSGHLIGNGLLALAVCVPAIRYLDPEGVAPFRISAGTVYVLLEPLGYAGSALIRLLPYPVYTAVHPVLFLGVYLCGLLLSVPLMLIFSRRKQ